MRNTSSTRPISSRRRAGVLAAAFITASVALVGCSLGPEDIDHASSNDGVRVELGELLMSNIMVLSAAEGQPGTVLGAVDNNRDEPAEVSIGLADEQAASFVVAPNETLLLGPEDHPVLIGPVPVIPGATVELVISSAEHGSTSAVVPVLDGTLSRYSDLVPSA